MSKTNESKSDASSELVVVETGGKQYNLKVGDVVDIEKIANPSKTVTLDKILFHSNGKEVRVGTPYLDDTAINCDVLEDDYKDKKVVVFKFKKKTGFKKTIGHRQRYTRIRVKEIIVGKKPKDTPKAEDTTNSKSTSDPKKTEKPKKASPAKKS